jgi:non-ribosomal peptide synthetase component F
MNSHRAISNRLQWMQAAYQLGPNDRILQKTPFSFDVSVWEFFWPLMTGASLTLARPEGHRDNAYLRGLIKEQRITTVHFVPSMLAMFLDEPGIEECVSLRRRSFARRFGQAFLLPPEYGTAQSLWANRSSG